MSMRRYFIEKFYIITIGQSFYAEICLVISWSYWRAKAAESKLNCVSARGPGADRHDKRLISINREGASAGCDSMLMQFERNM
jgi:hypothetical protein